ncbi:hypothetical protein AB3X93_23175 [Paraburkholderia sp. BR14262]|uniref:hypothetical protein n=1 Tax=unclassified Paraburkholderia TaxID=2615204 RepID=UPI0034CFC1C7
MKLHKNRDCAGRMGAMKPAGNDLKLDLHKNLDRHRQQRGALAPAICTKNRQTAAKGPTTAWATLPVLLLLCPWECPTRAIRAVLKGHFFSYRPQLVCFHTLLLYSTLYPNSDKKRINGENYRIAVDRSTCGSFRDH